MKKYIMIALLVLSHSFMAHAGPGEVKTLTRTEAAKRLETDKRFKEALEKISKGSKIDAKDIRFISLAVKTYLTGTSINEQNISSLVSLKPELLQDIMVQSSIIKDSSQTAEKKATATENLQILAEYSKQFDAMAPSAAEKVKADLDVISKISDIPDYNKEAKEFRIKLSSELSAGKSLDDAIKAASGGKIDRKKLTDCAV